MIRRGDYKYIHCETDEPLLFNLKHDPDELLNLAQEEAYADMFIAFQNEVKERWSSDLRQEVIASQHKRRTIQASMNTSIKAGQFITWDYQPKRDASQEYVRNHIDWTEAASKRRFPPLNKDGPKTK